MRLRALIPLIVMLVTACGSASTSPSGSSTGGGGNSGGGGGTSTGSSAFTATIDGAAWRPTTITARLGQNGRYLQIDTTDSALDLFGFAAGPVNGTVGVGTYDVNALADAGTNANYVLPGGTNTWTATLGHGSGSVTISAFSAASKTASGTFSFVLANGSGSSTKTVTNGTFNVTFP